MPTETTTLKGQPFVRADLESLMKRRGFYRPSFEIYKGPAGLFDYGPSGCALQNNIIALWRNHFVQREKMLEVDCTMLTPYEVFKASGHVDRFTDSMCKDPKTGDLFRADHLVKDTLEARLKADQEARGVTVETKEEDPKKKKSKVKKVASEKLDDALVQEYETVLAKLDNYNNDGLGELITKYTIRNPVTNGELLPPAEFNLMFQTSIGPSSSARGFLRPETAQGQFVNFQWLLDLNQKQMPFASASIGKSFRNEISPRNGLLRVREFLMAEIEHYVDPEGGKKHARFDDVRDVELELLNREVQLAGQTTVKTTKIGEAVEKGIVDNETLGYFLARIQLFLLKIGIDPSKIRFRQHMDNEMAHYASDCWDAELLTSYGWIESVGCADRSAYDLTVHKQAVRENRAEPLKIEEWACELDKKQAGIKFKKDNKSITAAIDALSQDIREKLSLDLEKEGKIVIDVPDVGDGKVEISKDLIKIEKVTRVENAREYIPNVIEPSFGIGRIIYALCEQVYWTREQDQARGVLTFPPIVAPNKVLIAPLFNKTEFKASERTLRNRLDDLGISNTTDDSGVSIGRRYARNDELGTPLGITIDYQSVKDNTFTLRDRDSTEQVRASLDEIIKAISSLTSGAEQWTDVAARLPKFEGQEVD